MAYPTQDAPNHHRIIYCQFCGNILENPTSNLCIKCFNFNPTPPNSPWSDLNHNDTTCNSNVPNGNEANLQPVCTSYQTLPGNRSTDGVTSLCVKKRPYTRREKVTEDKLLSKILDDVCDMWEEVGMPDDVIDDVLGCEYQKYKHNKKFAVKAIKRYLFNSTPYQVQSAHHTRSKFVGVEYYHQETNQWQRFNGPLKSASEPTQKMAPYYERPPPSYLPRKSLLYDLLSSPVAQN